MAGQQQVNVIARRPQPEQQLPLMDFAAGRGFRRDAAAGGAERHWARPVTLSSAAFTRA